MISYKKQMGFPVPVYGTTYFLFYFCSSLFSFLSLSFPPPCLSFAFPLRNQYPKLGNKKRLY